VGFVSWRRSRYGFALFFLVSLLVAFLALRATLVVHFRSELHAPGRDIVLAFLAGARRDLFVGLLVTLPLLAWFALLPDRWFRAGLHRLVFLGGFFLFWAGQVFSLVTEFYFFDEFRSRFNTVAVDYLLYPHEVFVNVRESYPVVPVVAACAGASLLWLLIALNRFRRMWDRPFRWRVRLAHLAGAAVLAAALLPGFNLKGERFSRERAINEIANNGLLSFVAAFWTRHLDYGVFYRTLPRAEAYERARRLLAAPGTEFAGGPDAILRRVAGDTNRPPLNVIIHLQESLGSEFWGALGRPGESCTPEMDRLALTEGLLFTNIYASGNRTIRGFEGVLASFPPLPGDSIVARDLSDNVETIARVLRRDGYRTLFLYGGRGLFDGMRSFTVRNGYERFIEQSDFPQPTFTTIWGVCDEDLMARTITECRTLARAGQSFLATVLSVSNHQPYTYPSGRIAADPNERRREHAVRYADYALGQFFRAARQETFWTNTVFVVVADHGARVYGSQSIPIRSYEIPLVILGPAVVPQPARLPQLGCSLDVAPTVLGLIGRPYQSLFFGRDLLAPGTDPGRVLIHHNRDIGLFSQDRLVVLALRQGIEFYAGNPRTDQLRRLDRPAALELELEKDATALFQVADDLYIHRRYCIDAN
jgi:phosphoglycerol transferase MdoB-like AlkP superfamily enzyme